MLIIDDAADNVRLLSRILDFAGFREIHSTTDPREAFGLYAIIRPHAVLLDLHMDHVIVLNERHLKRILSGYSNREAA